MTINEFFNIIRTELKSRTGRSAWDRGVYCYAIDLIDRMLCDIEHEHLEFDALYHAADINTYLLNGARDWKEYSHGGCALIYDQDIAITLCNKTELKRTHNGERQPNKYETWLDVQARALFQASNRIIKSINAALKEYERGSEL